MLKQSIAPVENIVASTTCYRCNKEIKVSIPRDGMIETMSEYQRGELLEAELIKKAKEHLIDGCSSAREDIKVLNKREVDILLFLFELIRGVHCDYHFLNSVEHEIIKYLQSAHFESNETYDFFCSIVRAKAINSGAGKIAHFESILSHANYI